MSASPRPQKRTASTCVTCRARKVRCDGRRAICTNCERLGFACSYDESVGVEVVQVESHTPNAIAVPRRRARQACLNCHAKKARCSGSMPKCDRCQLHGLECLYRPGKRSLPLPSTAASGAAGGSADVVMRDEPDLGAGYDQGAFTNSTSSPAGGTLEMPEPDEPLALRAFDEFFSHVHHIPMFSFMHRASLMERYHAGSLDRSLLLSLIGITALLADLGPGTEEYGERCIDEAASLCLAELERPSILRLQALVIVVKHRILSKRFSSAFMLHAIASRFATALRLNHENPNLCFLARESRRRLMWSISMADSALAGGQPDFALWADAERQIRIQLPCNERHFEFDLPEATEPLRPPPPGPDGTVPPLPDMVGFMALHVRIQWMRSKVLQCTTKATSAPSAEELGTLPIQCAALVAELEAFEARLPLSFRWSEGNLRLRTYSPRLGIFVMTHVWWRQCHIDLYRIFLAGLKEALPPAALAQLDSHFVAQSRQRCYEHARAMADMFAQVLSLSSSAPVTDIDLPGCALQCARMLHHGLQTAGGEMGFFAEGVQELAAVCLRAARQTTAGAACVSIQADIEKLIAQGLQLVGASDLSGAVPGAIHDREGSSMLPPRGIGLGPSSSQIAGHGMAAMSMGPLDLPADMTDVAPVAPSNVSGGTSGSNAFEEAIDGFSFGPEMFATDSWASFSTDWLNMGNFPQGGGAS
ncbi:hypothetical protein B0T25DRAFT_129833 [Lasiosphaeria hispida]|uniref:Zn(2)-C6 fungal-type domain-containing protein n=1 Tax=Lasiosphaeria hispida TaxID=260671 RepID=A0AAJ0HSG3_9PEZI|nr:hypothetical protein B0T25DRAFT_129833 [Lasiosphaeria hispida]